METIYRALVLMLLGLSMLVIGACGTTQVVESHPALVASGDEPVARVFFLRPNIGYHGVMGNAFSIEIAGQPLLTLAKDEYTLVHVRAFSGDLTVRSSTVVNRAGMNTMTKVEETRPFVFEAGQTYYVAFRPNSQGWLSSGGTSYIPVLISSEEAKKIASGLKAVGNLTQDAML